MATEQSLEVEREIFMRALSVVPPPPAVARQFARMVEDVEFPVGTVIYEEGSSPDNLYFIIHGSVELSVAGEVPWVFENDGVFGVLDALVGRPHSRTARALMTTRVLVIGAQDYFEIFEDNFEFARSILTTVARLTWEKNCELAPNCVWGPISAQAQTGEPIVPKCDNLIDRIITLKSTAPFDGARTQALAMLAAECVRVELAAGDTLFEMNSERGEIWVVAAGEIAISNGSFDASFGPCQLVGGSSALAGGSTPYAARAKADSTLLRLDLESIFDITEEQFHVMRELMKFNSLARELVTMREQKRLVSQGRGPGPVMKPG